jgi:uncharacterized protein (TIGR03435 family)
VGRPIGNLILCIFGALVTTNIATFIYAQEVNPTQKPDAFSFEVISIHPDPPDSVGGSARVSFGSSRYIAEHITAKSLLRQAYGVEDLQILNDPKWIDTTSFTIDATIDTTTAIALSRLNGEADRLARQHMLQALLSDRFHLVVRRETEERSIYSLTVAPGGPKLKKADPLNNYENGAKMFDGTPLGPHVIYYQFIAGDIQMKGQGASIGQLSNRLNQEVSKHVGRTFVDNTGITGRYDFELDFTVPWKTTFGMLAPGADFIDDSQGETTAHSPLHQALKEQLGLMIKSAKGPVPVIFVVHVENPSEN